VDTDSLFDLMRVIRLQFLSLPKVKKPGGDLSSTFYMFGSLAHSLHKLNQISAGTVQTSVVHSDV
jgi:hypothetical protein